MSDEPDKPDGKRWAKVSLPRRAATLTAVGGALVALVSCASVCMSAPPRGAYLAAASRLDVAIVSAKVRRRAQEGIEVSFTTSQAQVYLTWPKGAPCYRGNAVQFPQTTPKRITVTPGKPILLTLDALEGFGVPEDWRELDPGKYSLELWIQGNTKGQAEFDYHWLGIARTKPYAIIVK
jgi:hypothetical protein